MNWFGYRVFFKIFGFEMFDGFRVLGLFCWGLVCVFGYVMKFFFFIFLECVGNFGYGCIFFLEIIF